jgi:hypothetical protein
MRYDAKLVCWYAKCDTGCQDGKAAETALRVAQCTVGVSQVVASKQVLADNPTWAALGLTKRSKIRRKKDRQDLSVYKTESKLFHH